ncbi:MAG: transposase [Phycisphaerae bacterium]
MPEYRRWRDAGHTFFFTLVTHQRRAIFSEDKAIKLLRDAFRHVRDRHPFSIDAIVILPDHLHAIWTLPEHDDNYSMRWRLMKRHFTDTYLRTGGAECARSSSRVQKSERGIWQRRFWEHQIRDQVDFERHAEYIHYNPVKHGFVSCPHQWRYSSFTKWADRGDYPHDLGCCCPRGKGGVLTREKFNVPDVAAGE